MNILIITSWLFTKNTPTAGSFFVEQAEALANYGHTVHVLQADTFSVPHIKEYLQYSEPLQININGVQYYRSKAIAPLKRNNGICGNSEATANVILDLYEKYLKDKKIDIVHAHCTMWAGFAAYRLWKKYQLPYVITEHSTNFKLNSSLLTGLVKKNIQIALDNARLVLAVSLGLKNLLKDYTDNSIEVLGNVVDCNLFVPQPIPKSNNFAFFTLAYLETQAQIKKKGLDVLLDAFKILSEKIPNVTLVIGGGGKSSEILKERCENLCISDRVVFVGKLTRTEVAKQMQLCNSFVLPSRYETFGVVYAEAMACGRPVIATKTGGPDHFITDKNGFLIGVENIDELVSKMEEIIEKIDTYDYKEISAFIKENFSSEMIGKYLTEYYAQILNNRK